MYFSKESNLEHLGKKRTAVQAGRDAIPHVDAEKFGITPRIHFWFKQGEIEFDDSREIRSKRPDAAQKAIDATSAQFIIRGRELRDFATKQPTERYKELASWFDLDSLSAILQNLDALSKKIRKEINSTAEFDERLRDLGDVTEHEISEWHEQNVSGWFNTTVLSRLDNSIKIDTFSDNDSGFIELINRTKEEEKQKGLDSPKQLSRLIKELLTQQLAQHDDDLGYVALFEKAVSVMKDAETNEAKKQSQAKHAVFMNVWTHAQKLFEDNVDFDECPICETNISDDPHRSREKIHQSLQNKLAELDEYRQAKDETSNAKQELEQITDTFRHKIKEVSLLLDDSTHQCDEVFAYMNVLQSWDISGNAPTSNDLTNALTQLDSSLDKQINLLEHSNDESNTYRDALDLANKLLHIKTNFERITRKKTEMGKICDSLDQQTHALGIAITVHLKDKISELQDKVRTIYQAVQGSNYDVPLIRIELPSNESSNQKNVTLSVDFRDRKQVAPNSFLSDSQINTLALAIRLAAIQMFNSGFPVIVLDDVVTSYDAEHRANISKVLAECFSEFQIILVTHDWRFFKELRKCVVSECWAFQRIIRIEDERGPVFVDDKTRDEDIDAALNDGKKPGNEIRMAEEEWLTNICRDLKLKIPMPPLHDPYKHERSELASSLIGFLNKSKILQSQTLKNSNRYFASLQQADVENSTSHFSENPYEDISAKDLRSTWEDFKAFRQLFVCSCGGNFIKSREFGRLLCRKCGMPFPSSS